MNGQQFRRVWTAITDSEPGDSEPGDPGPLDDALVLADALEEQGLLGFAEKMRRAVVLTRQLERDERERPRARTGLDYAIRSVWRSTSLLARRLVPDALDGRLAWLVEHLRGNRRQLSLVRLNGSMLEWIVTQRSRPRREDDVLVPLLALHDAPTDVRFAPGHRTLAVDLLGDRWERRRVSRTRRRT